MVAGFIIFIITSLAWRIGGWLDSMASLVIQMGSSPDQRPGGLALRPKASKDMR
jgi:hypothetical protein